MIWLRVLDSPVLPWALATVTALIVGPAMLFIGRNWGRSEAPEVANRRLADAQRKVLQLTVQLSQTENALEHERDTKRSVIASARDLETTIAKHANRLVEAVQESVKHLLGCADQPTAQERAKKRTA